MKVLNLTQHAATPDQVVAGVVDIDADLKSALVSAITFPVLYTAETLTARARWVAGLVSAYNDKVSDADKVAHVMIGGMPSFMPPLQAELIAAGYTVGYACSERVSVDGEDVKHSGFYWAN